MPFKPTLVATAIDPVSNPYLGFPVTEIVLEEPNGEGSATPFVPTPETRDRFMESVTGSDVRVARRLLAEVEFQLDYVEADKKAEIERLAYDSRSVYISPNYGPHTLFSVPFQRSSYDITGNRTFVCTRAGTCFKWDEIDKVFRSWETDTTPIALHGAWSRYKSADFGHENKAVTPHPTSAGTGWGVLTGSGTITYSEDVLTPVLERRDVTNGKGVAVVTAVKQTPIVTVSSQTATGLSSTADVMGTVCLAVNGSYTVSLMGVGKVTAYDTYAGKGDGTFQLIKLQGTNTDASTQIEMRISFVELINTDILALIGPVYIGSETGALGYQRTPDWVETSHGQEKVHSTDGVELLLPEMTLSFFLKWPGDRYCGIAQFGSTSTGLGVLASGDQIRLRQQGLDYYWSPFDEWGIADGEWIHVVFTGGEDGANLFVNGQAHSDNGTHPWFPVKQTTAIDLGKQAGYSLTDSGISHVRLDHKVWTDDEIQDHYDTYFMDHGRGVIEPVFGKEMVIETMDWEARTGSGSNQWLARIRLKELGPDANHATMQRQEDV